MMAKAIEKETVRDTTPEEKIDAINQEFARFVQEKNIDLLLVAQSVKTNEQVSIASFLPEGWRPVILIRPGQ